MSLWVGEIKEEEFGWLMVNMDNGLVIMTGKSQSRTTTSRTISISLTLRAHPLSRMKKSDMLTKHIPPAACSSKGSQDGHNLHLTAPLYPATTYPEAKLTLLHTVGDPVLHQQRPSPFTTHGTTLNTGGGATCQLSASGDDWMGLTSELATPLPPQRGGMREVAYGRLGWIPPLFQKALRSLQGDQNFMLLFTRLSLIISQ